MRETQVQSLGWEDPLEKDVATHSSILVWRIPRTEDPGSVFELNPSQLVDVVSKVFYNREQKQGEVKWNAAFLVTALKRVT